MTELTDRERRVYTAALMGLVRAYHPHPDAHVTFFIGDDDVSEPFTVLRYTRRVLTWVSTREDFTLICEPRDPDAYWKGSDNG